MADVKWIKITTDIFDDEKILLIESMPSADSIITIWFKLLTLAGKQNNDGVFIMSNKLPYTDEMLSTIFRRDLNIVRLALRTFEEFGMIEIIDNVITIPNWGKHQTLDAYEKKKERDRIYQRERRERQKKTISQKSFDESSDVAVSEKEREKEKDKENNKKNNMCKSAETDALFERVWSLYPLKRGKAQVSNASKKRLLDVGFEEMKRAIDRYNADLEKEPWRKPQNGSTFFNSGYVDYLDENYKENVLQEARDAEISEDEELVGDDWWK